MRLPRWIRVSQADEHLPKLSPYSSIQRTRFYRFWSRFCRCIAQHYNLLSQRHSPSSSQRLRPEFLSVNQGFPKSAFVNMPQIRPRPFSSASAASEPHQDRRCLQRLPYQRWLHCPECKIPCRCPTAYQKTRGRRSS